jgi:hypothetical protein
MIDLRPNVTKTGLPASRFRLRALRRTRFVRRSVRLTSRELKARALSPRRGVAGP